MFVTYTLTRAGLVLLLLQEIKKNLKPAQLENIGEVCRIL